MGGTRAKGWLALFVEEKWNVEDQEVGGGSPLCP